MLPRFPTAEDSSREECIDVYGLGLDSEGTLGWLAEGASEGRTPCGLQVWALALLMGRKVGLGCQGPKYQSIQFYVARYKMTKRGARLTLSHTVDSECVQSEKSAD